MKNYKNNLKLKTCEKKHDLSKCKTCWMEKRYNIFRGHSMINLSKFPISELEEIRWMLMRMNWYIKEYKEKKQINNFKILNDAMKTKITALVWLKVGYNCFPQYLLPKLESNDKNISFKWVKDCEKMGFDFSKKMRVCAKKMELYNNPTENHKHLIIVVKL